MKDIGNNIRKLRVSKGLSMKDVAKKIPMTYTGYQQIEKGTNTTIEKIWKISEVLNVTPKQILFPNENSLTELLNKKTLEANTHAEMFLLCQKRLDDVFNTYMLREKYFIVIKNIFIKYYNVIIHIPNHNPEEVKAEIRKMDIEIIEKFFNLQVEDGVLRGFGNEKRTIRRSLKNLLQDQFEIFEFVDNRKVVNSIFANWDLAIEGFTF